MARRRIDGMRLEIGRHNLPVTVTSEGVFWCEWEGQGYSSATLKGLRVKMLPLVRDDLKRCEIPVLMETYRDDDRLAPITLIGIHASNGNVLYLDAEGKTHQESGRGDRIFRLLTPAELKTRARLRANVKRAERELRKWKAAHRVAPGKAVREKLKLPAEEPERNRWRRHGLGDDEDEDDLDL